jgi:hypothetical protein
MAIDEISFPLNLYVRLYWNLEMGEQDFFRWPLFEVNQDRDLDKKTLFSSDHAGLRTWLTGFALIG